MHARPIHAPATTEQLTPGSFLRRSATFFPDRIAVVDGDIRITYRQWLARSRRLAGLLASLDVKPGDRVAVLAPNSRMLLDAHYGTAMAGAVLVALNTRLTAPELQHIIEHSGATVLLYDTSLDQLAEQLAVEFSLDSETYEKRLIDAEELEIPVADEYSMIALNYTSGTTGRPKGVMYHHRGAYLQAMAMAFHSKLDTDTAHLWVLPMFHCNGWAFTWAVTAAGGTHVCLPKVDAGRIWELIDTEGITSFNAAPTVLIDLASHPAAHSVDKLLRVGTGGAPPSPTLLAQLGNLGFDITHLYGLTETFGPSAICEFPSEYSSLGMEEQARFKARQGNCNIAGTPLRVLDENGSDVPADGTTTGEIAVHGNTVALGYYLDAEATRQSFGSGWFRTGDLGVQHPDNYIELRDRSKDVIISGGENIASVEVEQVLERHADVLECAVVAESHERWGEVPVAYASVVDGSRLTEQELIAFARKILPGFKTPKRVIFGPLPKTGTGKIQKYILRNRLGHNPRPN
ncbi:AMP-binding protein [Rhodococcus sp. OK302]|uniref:AMP-binding protein n=1 Tax=Rhodococcus sp. OK302 TaxID=1882769 RepID=UPI000B941BCA|nr:AMP-binding protein [Rhodococcus sp. OK302]OYD67280.1 fatty-acyl-CoA synthase [Rhodococcus sp. OK302]